MRAPFLFCTITGQSVYQVGDNIIECGEGCFLLVPAGVPYAQLAGNESRPARKALRLAGPPEAPDVLAFSGWDNHMQCRLCHGYGPHFFVPNAAIVQLLDVLIEEAMARRSGYEVIGSSMLVGFLTMLQRDLAEGHSFGQAGAPAEARGLIDNIDPIERVRRHLKSHPNAPLTVEAAATMALMSRAQFTKRFRQVTGQSFVEYLTDCRLEETKMLLLETDWSISIIHNFVGFRDATRLRRLFQQREGVSPSEYRHKARQAGGPEAPARPNRRTP